MSRSDRDAAVDCRGAGIAEIAASRKPSSLRRTLLLTTALAALSASAGLAADISWVGDGAGNVYGTGTNWVGNVTPGATDNAVFGTNANSGIAINAAADVGGWIFNGASDYTFNADSAPLSFVQSGITINGGTATLITTNSGITFSNSSTAGAATFQSGGILTFGGSSNAGTANISVNSANGLHFNDTASAANAVIHNTNLDTTVIVFNQSSKGGNATITNDGDFIEFKDTSSAENATIFNNTSLGFTGNATAGNAAIVNGNTATTDFSFTTGPLSNGQISAGSIAGGGTFFIGGKTLTVGGNNTSTNVTGVIADNGLGGGGAGALVKDGTGTLILSGTNTYTGFTDVKGGVLQVDGSIATTDSVTIESGARLQGVGTVKNVAVSNGATFAPGAGNAVTSMNVTGDINFSAGSTYRVFINAASASFATATGTANIAGGTVNALIANGASLANRYTILQAGAVAGTFDTLTASAPAGFSASLDYTATEVQIAFTANAPVTANIRPSRSRTHRTITDYFNGGGALPPGFVDVLGLTGEAQDNALAQVSGQGAAGATQTSYAASNGFVDVIIGPSADTGGTRGTAYADEPTSTHRDEASRAALNAYAAVMPRDRQPTSFGARWSVWASGYGGVSTVDGSRTTGTASTTSRIYGSIVGLDYRPGRDTLVGFAMGGGGTSFGTTGLGSGRADVFQVGAYGRHDIGAAYVSGALAYSWQDVTTTRIVSTAGLDTLEGRYHAHTFTARGEAGWRRAPAFGGLTPYGALQFTSTHLPSYAESAKSGSSQFALSFGAQTANNLRSELGVRADKAFAMPNGVLTLLGRAAWAHDSNTDRTVTATFQALPGSSSFTTFGAQPAADAALVTAGFEAKWNRGWSIAASYEGEFSRTTETHAGRGVIRRVW